MINKRNSKVLKALSTAIVGSIAIGNCSTVWMMEKNNVIKYRHSKIMSSIYNYFTEKSENKIKLNISIPRKIYIIKNQKYIFNILDTIFEYIPYLNIDEWSNTITTNIIIGIIKNQDSKAIVNTFVKDYLDASLSVFNLPRRYLDESTIKVFDHYSIYNYLSKNPQIKNIKDEREALELYKDDLCKSLAYELNKPAERIKLLSYQGLLSIIGSEENKNPKFIRMLINKLCDVRAALKICS